MIELPVHKRSDLKTLFQDCFRIKEENTENEVYSADGLRLLEKELFLFFFKGNS